MKEYTLLLIPETLKKLKKEMIEKDYMNNEETVNFYLNIQNRFYHYLCAEEYRETKYFLLDIDSKDTSLLNMLRNIIFIFDVYSERRKRL